MSYCRWGCLGGTSDIYCFQSECGYIIHVASKKIVGGVPDELMYPKDTTVEEFIEYHKKLREFKQQAQREPIGLPYDSQTFSYDTPEETIEKLEELREVGYIVPEHTFIGLIEEIVK